ncbi:MAG: oxidoreductase [Armatimonadota bacterium]
MLQPDASRSGSFSLGGDLPVHRLGFGAMRITGEGVWGEPKDDAQARGLLRRLADLNVNFVDTADAYGPEVSERLIGEVLAPYPGGMVIATKGANTRPSPGQWEAVGRPAYLRQCVEMSLRRLKVERIDLWQLHRIDPHTPREDQFGVMKAFLDEGKVRHVGLSEVSIEEIEAARKIVPIVSVQNLYNLANRQSEDVLEYCERENIAFIPWFPMAAGDLARPGGILDTIAKDHEASVSQLALAWLLKRSPVMLPIPGTSSIAHLEENVGAAHIELSDAEFARIADAGRAATV